MQKPKILIIECDPFWSKHFRHQLLEIECEVRVAENCFEGLALLARNRPDAIVVDLCLSSISGEDVLDFINNESLFAHTKTVVVSDDEVWLEEIGDKADVRLRKPFGTQALGQIIKEMLFLGGCDQ